MNTGKENAKSIGTVRERERERELYFSKRKSGFGWQPDTPYVYQINNKKEKNKLIIKIRDG